MQVAHSRDWPGDSTLCCVRNDQGRHCRKGNISVQLSETEQIRHANECWDELDALQEEDKC